MNTLNTCFSPACFIRSAVCDVKEISSVFYDKMYVMTTSSAKRDETEDALCLHISIF